VGGGGGGRRGRLGEGIQGQVVVGMLGEEEVGSPLVDTPVAGMLAQGTPVAGMLG